MSRYRHKSRGTTYTTLTLAKLHVSASGKYAAGVASDTLLVVYRGDDGQVWARPQDEFFDGRFEQLPEE